MANKPTPRNTPSADRNYRDAGTGGYVTPQYAAKHPKTTVSEPRKK
jgi:hypothetical protein